jgi:hypothetical protein
LNVGVTGVIGVDGENFPGSYAIIFNRFPGQMPYNWMKKKKKK